MARRAAPPAVRRAVPLSAAQCASAGAAYAKVLAGALAASTGNTTDLSELQRRVRRARASIPSNLKSDYETVGKAYAQFEKDIKGVSLTDPCSTGKLQRPRSDLTPDVKAAAVKIRAYFKNHCQS